MSQPALSYVYISMLGVALVSLAIASRIFWLRLSRMGAAMADGHKSLADAHASHRQEVGLNLHGIELHVSRVSGELSSLIHLTNKLGEDLRAEVTQREELGRQLQAARDAHRFQLECLEKDVGARLSGGNPPLMAQDLTDEELRAAILEHRADTNKSHDLALQRRIVTHHLGRRLGLLGLGLGARHAAAIQKHVTKADEEPGGAK